MDGIVILVVEFPGGSLPHGHARRSREWRGTMTIRQSRRWAWFVAAALGVVALAAGLRLTGSFNQPSAPQGPIFELESNLATPAGTSQLSSDKGESGLVLEENERTYLWQIEHQGLVLNRHGFRPLADALGRGDQDALRNLMAAGFT